MLDCYTIFDLIHRTIAALKFILYEFKISYALNKGVSDLEPYTDYVLVPGRSCGNLIFFSRSNSLAVRTEKPV